MQPFQIEAPVGPAPIRDLKLLAIIKKNDKSKVMAGAGIASGLMIGFVTGGTAPILATFAGLTTAYCAGSTKLDGTVTADVAKVVGTVALQIRDKAVEINDEHHIVSKSVQTVSNAIDHIKKEIGTTAPKTNTIATATRDDNVNNNSNTSVSKTTKYISKKMKFVKDRTNYYFFSSSSNTRSNNIDNTNTDNTNENNIEDCVGEEDYVILDKESDNNNKNTNTNNCCSNKKQDHRPPRVVTAATTTEKQQNNIDSIDYDNEIPSYVTSDTQCREDMSTANTTFVSIAYSGMDEELMAASYPPPYMPPSSISPITAIFNDDHDDYNNDNFIKKDEHYESLIATNIYG